MVSTNLWSHALTVVVAVLLTSGIWLTAYFVGVKPDKTTIYNNINNNQPNNTCGAPPPLPKCGSTCEFVVCESIPAGLQFGSQYTVYNKTTDCWMRLLAAAQSDVILASSYWSLLLNETGDGYTVDPTNTSGDGSLIYNTILSTAKRGVNFRITQNDQQGGTVETANLARDSNGKIQVRTLNFRNWYPGGILHTKSWSVDGKHFYVGSANFDWRSLTQVKEIGIAVYNCPCLAGDLKKLLEVYWHMGAPGAQLPKQWPSNYSTASNSQTPTVVPQPLKESQAVYLSASPPGFQACGREDDITTMVREIDAAQEFVNLAVMDYAPNTLYLGANNNFWYPALDDAIRRAAFDRQVKVRFLLSRWSHTYTQFYSYMHSLQDLSDTLPCSRFDNGTCSGQGSIEVRFIQVPDMSYGGIPYSRVYHNKYFTTEKTAYIGTSNWSADYWLTTAGIGVVMKSDDVTQKSYLVGQIQSIFERDWNSNYTIPLSYFDNSGNWTNGTSTH